MSMQDEDDQQDDTTGAIPEGASVDPRSPVSKFGAEAPSFANAPGVGINAPGAQGQGAIPEPQEQGQGPVAGDPGNQMRSPAGQEGDKFQKDWQGVKDVAGQVGDRMKASPAGQLIMRYLAGADADPQLTQQAEAAAAQELSKQQPDPYANYGDQQPQGPSQSDVRLMALHLAAEHGGPDAGYKVQQTYRASYAAAMGHAHVALNGSEEKPGDLAVAAASATKAASYVLDGTDTSYAPSPDGNGITATVKYAGSKAPQVTQLTVPQFNQLTDIGDVNGGQYDAVHENANMLQKIAAGPGKPMAGQGQTQGQGDQTLVGTTGNGKKIMSAPVGPGYTPGNQPDNMPAAGPKPGDYSPDLEAKSRRIFPTVGQEQQRQLWLAKMEQQGEVNATNRIKAETPLGVAGVRAGATTEAATTRAGGQVAAAQAHSQGQVDAAMIRAASTNENARLRVSGVLAQVAANTQNKQAATAAVLLKQKLANVALGQALSPQDEQQILALTTQGSQAAQQGQQQGQQQDQGDQGQPTAPVTRAPAAPAKPAPGPQAPQVGSGPVIKYDTKGTPYKRNPASGMWEPQQ